MTNILQEQTEETEKQSRIRPDLRYLCYLLFKIRL